jgi:hypothetical protein
MKSRHHIICRVCGSARLHKYIDLGLMPLSNNLEATSAAARASDRYPLQVLFCEDCYLSQLSVVIDPRVLYSYYTYRSGVNQGYVTHCRQMAAELQMRYGLSEDSFQIDIAGNDGTLLQQFRNEIGLRVLNVDPASNLIAVSEQAGIESLAEFWSVSVAKQIARTHGRADLITATNVFAHVDNVTDFMLAALNLIKPTGLLVLEFPYLIDLIHRAEFDTIYFEHLSYFSLLPLRRLCQATGMRIIDAEKQEIHGGSLRVTLAPGGTPWGVNPRVDLLLESEKALGICRLAWYVDYAEQVQDKVEAVANQLIELKNAGKTIAAFGASAKGNVLLNCANIGTDIIDYIIDDTPEKIGRFSPGLGLPIRPRQILLEQPPDYLVILSWNFAEEIMEKLRPIYHGQYIIPTDGTR